MVLATIALAALSSQPQALPGAAIGNKISMPSVEKTLEEALGEKLDPQQLAAIETIRDAVANAPRDVVFGRDQTVLICVGATAAYVINAQVAACSDTQFNPFYLQSIGYGAVFGLAGQVFVFAAMHDNDQPIAPQFTAGFLGGTSARATELFGLLRGMAQVAPLIGPEFGAFHSVIGNQAGMLFGINVGRVIGFGLSKILIYDSFIDMVLGIRNGVWSLEDDEFQARIEARKKRLGIQ